MAVSLVAYFIVPTWSHKATFVRRPLLDSHALFTDCLIVNGVGKETPFGTIRRRLGRRTYRAFRVGLRTSSLDRPFSLGICLPIPRIRLRSLFFESFPGK